MTTPTIASHGENASLTSLVREALRLGIEVPESVTDELDLHNRLTRDPLNSQRGLQKAYAALQSAQPTQVDDALDALAEASVKTLAAQGLTETLNGVALIRLRNAVYSELDLWEKQAVAAFNRIVDESEANEVGRDLPDLTQVVSPIDLTPAQSHALQVWRDLAEELHPLWGLYTRIQTLNGHEVGPAPADGLSTNLSLATRLGNPGSFAVAQNAAVAFASLGSLTDAQRKFGVLAPFAVVALCGYELHLSTSEDAAAIRRQIQPAA